ncbi:MAG TPA: copper chaperone PCu(A)C [Stellaceae bacterium]|nr:copper chaperone PCu(A)C [Stellaceae bacterium]
MRRTLLRLGLVAGALAGAVGARAGEGGLTLSHQWFRLVLPSLPAAGYFTLSNSGAAAQSLVGASSPGCGMLMLHRSINSGGQERMAMVQNVAVPAHGKVSFAPGGYHMMCMSPTAALRPGRSVLVTLRFADGGSLTASFPVRNATGK